LIRRVVAASAVLAAWLLAAGLAGFGVSVLVAAAVAAAVLVHRAGTAHRGGRRDFDRALLRRESPPRRPEELTRLERAVALGVAHAGDLHTRLRPRLRTIAATLLAARGLELDQARSLLGDDLWALVRSDREAPADPFAPGVEPGRLAVAVETLESLQDLEEAVSK
jgi:hypothetical protein